MPVTNSAGSAGDVCSRTAQQRVSVLPPLLGVGMPQDPGVARQLTLGLPGAVGQPAKRIEPMEGRKPAQHPGDQAIARADVPHFVQQDEP